MARRLTIFRLLLLTAFGLILVRLVYLQVVCGAENRRSAEENRIRIVPRRAPRGTIYDCKGRVLATSRLSFSVCVVPEELEVAGSADPVASLAAVLGQPARVAQTLERARGRHVEAVLLARAEPEVVARVAENSPYLTGVMLAADPVREYPQGSCAAHVLGYAHRISAEELARPSPESTLRTRWSAGRGWSGARTRG